MWTTAPTRLATRRVACGLGIEDMARVCGISTRTYARLEHDELESVPLWLLNNCALALGVQLEDLIEPHWRDWRDPYGTQPRPPDPEQFWRRDPDT